MLIENGNIIESGLKKVKLDINELLSETRSKGYFDLKEINYAFMETDGNISFLPFNKDKPSTKKDLKIKCEDGRITTNVIIDRVCLFNNLKAINKDEKWLLHELKVQGYNDYNDILLATIDDKEKVTIYRKNIKPEKNTVLE